MNRNEFLKLSALVLGATILGGTGLVVFLNRFDRGYKIENGDSSAEVPIDLEEALNNENYPEFIIRAARKDLQPENFDPFSPQTSKYFGSEMVDSLFQTPVAVRNKTFEELSSSEHPVMEEDIIAYIQKTIVPLMANSGNSSLLDATEAFKAYPVTVNYFRDMEAASFVESSQEVNGLIRSTEPRFVINGEKFLKQPFGEGMINLDWLVEMFQRAQEARFDGWIDYEYYPIMGETPPPQEYWQAMDPIRRAWSSWMTAAFVDNLVHLGDRKFRDHFTSIQSPFSSLANRQLPGTHWYDPEWITAVNSQGD